MSELRMMIVIGDVLHEPWRSISLRGQIPTWLAEFDPDRPQRGDVVVRHSHASRLGAIGGRLDRWHEQARWSTHGRTRVPKVDDAVGSLFRGRLQRVEVTQWADTGQVAWHQHMPDAFALQRWKIMGSLTQALKEPWDIVYFTTASSYVRVDRLLDIAASLPRTGLYAGTRMVEGATQEVFASGASRLLSRDVAQYVVDHPGLYRNDVMEDAGLGRSIATTGVAVTPLPSLNIGSPAELDALGDDALLEQFHFRLKSESPAGQRDDVTLMHRLHARLAPLDDRV